MDTNFVNIRRHGTIVLANSILCDGNDPGDMDFGKNITCYSHIHSDHLKGLDERLGVTNSEVYCTPVTKKIASAIYQGDVSMLHERDNFWGLEFNENISIDAPNSGYKKIKLSLKKCHHILGSAGILVQADDTSIFYVGDFLKDGTHVENDVDYLILDATHGQHSENQNFLDPPEARKNLAALVKKLVDEAEDKGRPPRINIHAHRGTMQLVMAWLREIVPPATKFLSAKKDVNTARVYSDFGHECGNVEDDDKHIERYAKEDVSYIHFLPMMSMPPECEVFGETPPTIRIGSGSNTTTSSQDKMYHINLKEHATIPEILDYVEETKPKNIIIDNSIRVENPDNASYLGDKIRKIHDSVILLPEKHPKGF